MIQKSVEIGKLIVTMGLSPLQERVVIVVIEVHPDQPDLTSLYQQVESDFISKREALKLFWEVASELTYNWN